MSTLTLAYPTTATDEERADRFITKCVIDGADQIRAMLGIGSTPAVAAPPPAGQRANASSGLRMNTTSRYQSDV